MFLDGLSDDRECLTGIDSRPGHSVSRHHNVGRGGRQVDVDRGRHERGGICAVTHRHVGTGEGLSVDSQEYSRLHRESVVVDSHIDAARVDGAEPLVDVGDVGLISGGRHNSEEVVLLVSRQTVGQNARANSDVGSVATLSDRFDAQSQRFELAQHLDTVIAVEVVSVGARRADVGTDALGTFLRAALALTIIVSEPA